MSKSVALISSLVFAVVLLTFGLSATAQNSAETQGAIYQVTYDDPADLAPYLAFDLWQDRITEGSVNIRMTDAQRDSVVGSSAEVTLLTEATDSLYVDRSERGGDTIPGFACYRTVEATATDLAQLAVDFPDLVDVIDIGDSYEKTTAGGLAGYDLYAYKITNETMMPATPKPVYFIIAAVHAREYTTAETATRFVEDIVTSYGTDPDATWLLDHYELHVIPQGNPDGRKVAETGVSQRKNTNPFGCSIASRQGIDLNRNVSYQWGIEAGGLSSGDACNDLYHGPTAASETETAAFEAYAQSILLDQRADTLTDAAPIDTTGMFITIHSALPAILPAWAWTDYDANPNFDGHNALGRKMAFFNNYRVYGTNAGIGGASGTHDDYVYGEFGVPSFTYELGNTFFQSCSSFDNTIYPDNFDALLYGFKAARMPYAQATGPDVATFTASADGFMSANGFLQVSQGLTLTLEAVADDNRYHQDSFYQSNPFGVDATIAVQNVQTMTVSIDVPNWMTPTLAYKMDPSDGAFDSSAETGTLSLDTSSWPVGRHIVYVEAADSSGTIGVPTALFIDIIEGTPTRIYLPLIEKAPAAEQSSTIGNRLLAGYGGLSMLTLLGVGMQTNKRGKLAE